MIDSLSSVKAKISLIVPVLNEAQAIPVFYAAVTQFMLLQDVTLELIFVDDGSTDATPDILRDLKAKDCRVIPLSFTRHFGKEAALMAGLAHSTGDAVVPIDVDLQDPIEVIPQLIGEWRNGSEIVLAKRSDRASDGWLKRNTALAFYRLHNAISSPKIEENVGDFRLLSRSVVDNVLKLDERNLFMKGILSWPGGKTSIVEYVRKPRTVGRSRFNGRKLWHLALDGITSFSTVPLRIWTYIGSLIALASFAYGVFLILKKLLFEIDVSGYASIMVSILFLGGIQLIGIGVVGEYIGRIYQEVKHRPRYVLKKDSSDEA